MALLLRTCTIGQKRLRLEEFASLTRSVTRVKRCESNIKKPAPILQFMRFSTNSDQKNKDLIEIYNGELTNLVWVTKFFSTTAAALGLVSQPLLYLKAVEMDTVASFIGISAIFIITGIAMPLVINLGTKTYVLKMYYDPKENKYICTTYTLFLRKKEIKFTPDDVVAADANAGNFTTCFIKKEPVFFDNPQFGDKNHYIKIMGYNKPVDFKLGNVRSENVKTVLKDRE